MYCSLRLSPWSWNSCSSIFLTIKYCLFYILLSTAVDCGPLSNLTNGQVSHTAGTTFGQTATYSCNTGYNLVGDSIRMCQANGEWSGSVSTCQSMFCVCKHEYCGEQKIASYLSCCNHCQLSVCMCVCCACVHAFACLCLWASVYVCVYMCNMYLMYPSFQQL